MKLRVTMMTNDLTSSWTKTTPHILRTAEKTCHRKSSSPPLTDTHHETDARGREESQDAPVLSRIVRLDALHLHQDLPVDRRETIRKQVGTRTTRRSETSSGKRTHASRYTLTSRTRCIEVRDGRRSIEAGRRVREEVSLI